MNEEFLSTVRDINAHIFALQAGLMAVIQDHPEPKKLRLRLDALEEALLANMLNAWPDDHIAIFQEDVKALRGKIPR